MEQEQETEFAPLNLYRPEQPDLRRWLRVLSDLAVLYPEKGTASPQYRVFKNPQSPRPVQTKPEHFLTWYNLVSNGFDLSGDFTNSWTSVKTMAIEMGQSHRDVTMWLHDLEFSVRLIATQRRGPKESNEIHLFTKPLGLGETWEMREGKRVIIPARLSVSDEAIMDAFRGCFGQLEALNDRKRQESFQRAIQRFRKDHGASRLRDLFVAMSTDNSEDGYLIRTRLQNAASPAAYLEKCFGDWFVKYEVLMPAVTNEVATGDDQFEDEEENEREYPQQPPPPTPVRPQQQTHSLRQPVTPEPEPGPEEESEPEEQMDRWGRGVSPAVVAGGTDGNS
jgi:hypothetical protein